MPTPRMPPQPSSASSLLVADLDRHLRAPRPFDDLLDRGLDRVGEARRREVAGRGVHPVAGRGHGLGDDLRLVEGLAELLLRAPTGSARRPRRAAPASRRRRTSSCTPCTCSRPAGSPRSPRAPARPSRPAARARPRRRWSTARAAAPAARRTTLGGRRLALAELAEARRAPAAGTTAACRSAPWRPRRPCRSTPSEASSGRKRAAVRRGDLLAARRHAEPVRVPCRPAPRPTTTASQRVFAGLALRSV